MKRLSLAACLAAGLFFFGCLEASAADKLTLSGIGTMEVPKGITFSQGAQNALPFVKEGGTKRFFIRKGIQRSLLQQSMEVEFLILQKQFFDLHKRQES